MHIQLSSLVLILLGADLPSALALVVSSRPPCGGRPLSSGFGLATNFTVPNNTILPYTATTAGSTIIDASSSTVSLTGALSTAATTTLFTISDVTSSTTTTLLVSIATTITDTTATTPATTTTSTDVPTSTATSSDTLSAATSTSANTLTTATSSLTTTTSGTTTTAAATQETFKIINVLAGSAENNQYLTTDSMDSTHFSFANSGEDFYRDLDTGYMYPSSDPTKFLCTSYVYGPTTDLYLYNPSKLVVCDASASLGYDASDGGSLAALSCTVDDDTNLLSCALETDPSLNLSYSWDRFFLLDGDMEEMVLAVGYSEVNGISEVVLYKTTS
ncbi:hypothetical protein BX600DRAFT_429913 [Xylariales sp. PMI_506]|nr:hypothetical protein BX600DRAFT_429913 [Xylariales sp. PMI_506]